LIQPLLNIHLIKPMKLQRILQGILQWTSLAIFLAVFVGITALFVVYWRSTNDCDRTAAPKNPMQAIVYCDYGLSNLRLEDVEKPVPNDDQVLVKVHAASVNPYDWTSRSRNKDRKSTRLNSSHT